VILTYKYSASVRGGPDLQLRGDVLHTSPQRNLATGLKTRGACWRFSGCYFTM